MNSRALKAFSSFERIFVVTVLLLSTGALLSLLHRTSTSNVDLVQGDPVTQMVWTGVYAVTALLACTQWRRITYFVPRNKLLLLLVGIAMASVLWSVEPGLTLRRSLTSAATTLFGAYVAARYSTSELLRLLAWAFGIAALLSLVITLTLPGYGIYIDPRGEAWRGIYWHKNALGSSMALSALVFLCVAAGGHTRRWIAWGGIGLSTILVLLSESKTALISLLALLALYPLFKTLRWRSTSVVVPFYIIVALAGGIAVALLLANLQDILSALGRDVTLSGRTELWDAVFEMIRQRPWLGYGHGAFWVGWVGESAHVLLWMIGIEGSYGHESTDNGFLELWLQLGLLGLLVFMCTLVQAYFRAVRWARLTKTIEGLWPLMFVTFLLFYNFSESAVLVHNSILWILYVQALLSTSVLASANPRPSNVGVILGKEGTKSI